VRGRRREWACADAGPDPRGGRPGDPDTMGSRSGWKEKAGLKAEEAEEAEGAPVAAIPMEGGAGEDASVTVGDAKADDLGAGPVPVLARLEKPVLVGAAAVTWPRTSVAVGFASVTGASAVRRLRPTTGAIRAGRSGVEEPDVDVDDDDDDDDDDAGEGGEGNSPSMPSSDAEDAPAPRCFRAAELPLREGGGAGGGGVSPAPAAREPLVPCASWGTEEEDEGKVAAGAGAGARGTSRSSPKKRETSMSSAVGGAATGLEDGGARMRLGGARGNPAPGPLVGSLDAQMKEDVATM
jgi:hypothetical protein